MAYEQQLAKALSGINYSLISDLVKQELDDLIYIGTKPRNFVSYIENEDFRKDIQKTQLPYLQIDGNALYVLVSQVSDVNKAGSELYALLSRHQIIFSYKQLKYILSPQENRYVKIASNMSHELVNELKQRKNYWVTEQQKLVSGKKRAQEKVGDDDLIPLLHGLGFEQKTIRNYPFGEYLAHVL